MLASSAARSTVVSKLAVAFSSAASASAHTRAMSTKVCVLGAAGGIGQPLSLLLKLSPHIDELSCYDIVGTPGVAADLSHVSSFPSMYRCISCATVAATATAMIKLHSLKERLVKLGSRRVQMDQQDPAGSQVSLCDLLTIAFFSILPNHILRVLSTSRIEYCIWHRSRHVLASRVTCPLQALGLRAPTKAWAKL